MTRRHTPCARTTCRQTTHGSGRRAMPPRPTQRAGFLILGSLFLPGRLRPGRRQASDCLLLLLGRRCQIKRVRLHGPAIDLGSRHRGRLDRRRRVGGGRKGGRRRECGKSLEFVRSFTDGSGRSRQARRRTRDLAEMTRVFKLQHRGLQWAFDCKLGAERWTGAEGNSRYVALVRTRRAKRALRCRTTL
jgi:hypothetical protein